jgi:hypothetical protein
MEIEDLSNKEKAIIEILRVFKFLKEFDYHEKELTMGGRESPSIVFHNWNANRLIRVIGDESSSWSIVIQRKKIFTVKMKDSFFDISDYYSYFNCAMIKGRNYTLDAQAEFIKNHIMPVIKGEKWIDELIKQKK